MRLLCLLMLILGVSCSHVFYQPSKHEYSRPEDYKLTYENVWFPSSDGTSLHGWFFPARGPVAKGTIIQFHGNAQNISTHYFSLIWLVEQGYNLFTWDYRGYGRSQGGPSQASVHQDALAALEKGKELHGGKGLLVVYGQSLGGAISLRAMADFPSAREVDLLVHDSSFTSYKDVAFSVLQTRWFLWPFSPLGLVLVSDEYAPEKILDLAHWPTLVIVGKNDTVMPAKFGKETYKRIPSNRKWLWELPEGKHIDVFHHAEGKYRQEFTRFLEGLVPR